MMQQRYELKYKVKLFLIFLFICFERKGGNFPAIFDDWPQLS